MVSTLNSYLKDLGRLQFCINKEIGYLLICDKYNDKYYTLLFFTGLQSCESAKH